MLTADEERDVRLLCCYFPTNMESISTCSGRKLLISLFAIKISTGLLVTGLGIWQCVFALSSENEYASYLFVFLTVLYSFFLFWQLLHSKGLKILRRMRNDDATTSVMRAALLELQQQHKQQQPRTIIHTSSGKQKVVVVSRGGGVSSSSISNKLLPPISDGCDKRSTERDDNASAGDMRDVDSCISGGGGGGIIRCVADAVDSSSETSREQHTMLHDVQCNGRQLMHTAALQVSGVVVSWVLAYVVVHIVV